MGEACPAPARSPVATQPIGATIPPMPSPTIGYGLPVSPAARKVLPLVPKIITEGWSAAKLSRESGVSLCACKGYLKTIHDQISRESAAAASTVTVDALAVARRVQSKQVGTAERVEELAGKVLESLESRAEAGELSPKDLDTLVKLRKTHMEHVKELSGQALAEKALLARVKGEAMGAGFGRAIIDATAGELMGELWEAETEILPPADNGSEGESA